MAMSPVSGATPTPTLIAAQVDSPPEAPVPSAVEDVAVLHAETQAELSQSQRMESKQGSGNVRATGDGEGNAIATTGVESSGTATAVADGDGHADATVPDGAEGNALAQTEGGGDAEATSGASGNAVAVSRAEGDAQAHASENGNALAIANSLGEAKAHSEGEGMNAVAVAEDIGNAHAHAIRGGSAVALARGVGDVEARVADGAGKAGSITAIGLGSGGTRGVQNSTGFFAVINRSGMDADVTNNSTGTVRFEFSEEGFVRLTINGTAKDYLPNPGTTGYSILANGNLTGGTPISAPA